MSSTASPAVPGTQRCGDPARRGVTGDIPLHARAQRCASLIRERPRGQRPFGPGPGGRSPPGPRAAGTRKGSPRGGGLQGPENEEGPGLEAEPFFIRPRKTGTPRNKLVEVADMDLNQSYFDGSMPLFVRQSPISRRIEERISLESVRVRIRNLTDSRCQPAISPPDRTRSARCRHAR